MNIKVIVKRITPVFIIVGVVCFFWPSEPKQPHVFKEQTLPLSNNVTPLLKAKENPIVKPVISKVNMINSLISSQDSAILVAKAYENNITYPSYSKPLTNNDFYQLNPNFFNPLVMPIDDEGNTITAQLSKYRYTYPEPIFVNLSGNNITSATLKLVDLTTKNIIETVALTQENMNWNANINGSEDFPAQLQIVVTANVKHKEIPVALSLQYVNPVATLNDITEASLDNEDMVITANIETRKEGLYRIRANLFDSNNNPIAHLVAKEKLSKGNEKVTLKAHQSVLNGVQTPLYLTTFTVELMSPAPGVPKQFGNSKIKKYMIEDLAISSLNKTAYQPTQQEKQRLALLENMAKKS